MTRVRVDPGELAEAVDRIDAVGRALATALQQAEDEVAAAHATWTGVAAAAHRATHDRWQRAAEQMHQALIGLHGIASTAHGNYDAAVTANLAMWGR